MKFPWKSAPPRSQRLKSRTVRLWRHYVEKLQHRSAARPPADRKPAAEEEDSTFAACRRLAVTAGTRAAEGQRRRPSVPALTASGEAIRPVSHRHPARLLAWRLHTRQVPHRGVYSISLRENKWAELVRIEREVVNNVISFFERKISS